MKIKCKSKHYKGDWYADIFTIIWDLMILLGHSLTEIAIYLWIIPQFPFLRMVGNTAEIRLNAFLAIFCITMAVFFKIGSRFINYEPSKMSSACAKGEFVIEWGRKK